MKHQLWLLLLMAAIFATTVGVGVGQTPGPSLQDLLKRLFPSAASISAKEGSLPHFKVFARSFSGAQTLGGVAFLTTEVEPLERGYHGPIKILVGLNADLKLAGIIIVEEHEPYGYFSIDRPQFAAQFIGKDIRDPFKVGADVDAVSTASITINSAARAIRNGARRVARQLLTPPPR
jgi:transcriptional regulator of nitric oxide reductase